MLPPPSTSHQRQEQHHHLLAPTHHGGVPPDARPAALARWEANVASSRTGSLRRLELCTHGRNMQEHAGTCMFRPRVDYSTFT